MTEGTVLKTAIQTLGHTRALKDGSVRLPGHRLEFEEVPLIIQAFRRMVRGLEFDISEMAVTTYLCARAHGRPFTALPVFLVRGFHHGAIVCNTRLGIREPKDLEGRKVGVNRGYTVTTGVWVRGILQHQYGVDLDKVSWVLSGDEHVAEFVPPPNVVPIERGRTLEELLVAGEIAAAIGVQVDHPDVKPLIADGTGLGYRMLQDSGHYPINHTLVVKDSRLAAEPQLATQLFEAFAEAKRRYLERLRAGIAEPDKNDRMYRKVMQLTGADPLPYGIEANRAMLETLAGYAYEQGILKQRTPLEQLFAPGSLALAA